MFRFENPIFLYLLLILPALWMMWRVSRKRQKKDIGKFGDPQLVEQMMENRSSYRPTVKFWLLLVALGLLIIMLARPQMGSKISNEQRQGIEAIIALDISNSMLAEDVKPSRLDKCKMIVENMVDHFVDDKVGMIVFAGDAFVQLPITTDYVSAKMFMQNISPSLIASQGTDIATAIDLSMKCFTADENTGKAIIIITDGEDHEGGALEAAKAAADKGIQVFVLGVGNIAGAPIPVQGGGYMIDNTGETVMTRLNEKMCQEIAEAGNGIYIHVDNTSKAQEKLDEHIAKMQKGELTSVIYSEYDEQYQAVGIIVMLLLIIEVCILERKNKFINKFKFFK